MWPVKYDASKKLWFRQIKTRFYHETVSIGYVAITELAKFPDRFIQISDDSGYQMTCSEMRSKIIQAAIHFERLDLEQGDVIGVCARNSQNVAPMIMGCLLNGFTVNPIDVTFSEDDMQHMFSITKPKVILCDSDQCDKLSAVSKHIGISPTIVTFGENIEGCQHEDEYFQETHRALFYLPTALKYGDDQAAFIVCSSGTTGYHKGISLSHSQLLKKVMDRIPFLGATTFTTSSLYWLSGIDNMLFSLLNSWTRIITTKLITDDVIFNIVSKYRVTNIVIPPMYLAVMLSSPLFKIADLSSIKILAVTGSATPTAFLEQIQTQLPTSCVVYAYGMTELCGVCCTNRSRENFDSVGLLYPDIQARIIDVDGNLLGPNETGELLMRDVCFKFLGYKNNPIATSEICDRDGWIHSGDIGHFDDNGQLYVTGRSKEIIKNGNYHVSPIELEEVIGVYKGVKQLCVFGMPDPVKTDIPAALIVRNEFINEYELLRYLDRELPDYKKLHGGIYFVDSIPQTASGKFKRKEALEIAIRIRNDSLSKL